jgi:hypothetical protein
LVQSQHTRDKVSDDGVPRRSVIISNWCTTFFPGNRGLPVRSSANIHPILQTSIAGVYCVQFETCQKEKWMAMAKLIQTENLLQKNITASSFSRVY